jgi:hypothetical protein
MPNKQRSLVLEIDRGYTFWAIQSNAKLTS